MKPFVFLIGLFTVLTAFSQEEELFQVSPHWKVGDAKKVHTEISTKVIYDDSLVSNIRTVYDFKVKVAAVGKSFSLNFQSSDKLLSVISHSKDDPKSPAFKKINNLLVDAEIQIGESEFRIEVDKANGTALEIKNGLEIARKIKFNCLKELREWCAKESIAESEQRLIQVELSKRFDEMYPKIERQILNKVSSVFSAYNVSFPMNTSITQNVMTHDLTAASKSDTLFPAVMKMETIEVNDKMIVKTSLEYDKAFLLQQLKKSYDKLEKVEPNDVSIIEKEEIIFDLNSTWLVQHTTNMHFQIPGMKTLTKSVVTIL